MKRSEFCNLVGVESSRFKTQVHQGNIPFNLQTAGLDGDRKWARYTYRHAGNYFAALVLADEQGVQWSDACTILRYGNGPSGGPLDGWGCVRCGPELMQSGAAIPYYSPDLSPEDIYFGRAVYMDEHGRSPKFSVSKNTVFVGPLFSIAKEAVERPEPHNRRASDRSASVKLTSLVTVNVSEAFRHAKATMRQLGYNVGADASE